MELLAIAGITLLTEFVIMVIDITMGAVQLMTRY